MNTTILAILLSSILCFIVGLLSKNVSFKKLRTILLFAALVATAIALLLKSRAALLGCSISGLYILFNSKHFNQKKLLIFSLLLICTLLFSFLFIKKDSGSGRWLIYKVTFSQLSAQDYIYGIGLGKFKARYNQFQANYFADKDLNSKEALLADNSYYLFNDWLQAAIEIGLVGLAIVVGIVFLFFTIYRYHPNNNRWLWAANSSLICISVAALFSYPLQTPLIFIFFFLCIVLHFYYSYQLKSIFQNRLFISIKNSLLISITCLAIYYSYKIYQYKKQSKEAFELSTMGYKNEAEKIFKHLENGSFADYSTYYNYAYLLYIRNQPVKALEKVNKAISLACHVEAIKLKATILNELKDSTNAEKYYVKAVYMVPNRMQTKYDLMQFYMQQKDSVKAKNWADKIVTMKIKIPSATTEDLLNKTKKLMSSL